MDYKKSHFSDLASRANRGNYAVFSEFLGLLEISELQSSRLEILPTLWGGFSGAERVVAGFGECENWDFPISCIEIKPLNKKFADELSHRDFLGSLMGLGIKRETLGDIIINDNCGYLFCLDTIAQYIADNLREIKHTTVTAEILEDIPETAIPQPQIEEHIVSSLRLDVLVASVFNLSRNKAGELFQKEKVFVNGSIKNASYVLKEGESITVRGFGKFIYSEILRKTKKDRLVVELKVYK